MENVQNNKINTEVETDSIQEIIYILNTRDFESTTISKRKGNGREKLKEAIEKHGSVSKDVVLEIIKKYSLRKEINRIRDLYNKTRAHSIRHIQNVVLFGTMLGEDLGLSLEDIRLLIEACKYHDCGREDDRKKDHAEASQLIANKELDGKYEPSDIGIIRAAIKFHEEPHEHISEEDFAMISRKYNVREEDINRTYQIALCLRDADALDRCRFVNHASLNPNRLNNPEAFKLIALSVMINEGYAEIDLKKRDLESLNNMFKEVGEDTSKLLEENGFLSIEKAIRKVMRRHQKANNNSNKGRVSRRNIGKRAINVYDANNLNDIGNTGQMLNDQPEKQIKGGNS